MTTAGCWFAVVVDSIANVFVLVGWFAGCSRGSAVAEQRELLAGIAVAVGNVVELGTGTDFDLNPACCSAPTVVA